MRWFLYRQLVLIWRSGVGKIIIAVIVLNLLIALIVLGSIAPK